jgi:hypothetical protein
MSPALLLLNVEACAMRTSFLVGVLVVLVVVGFFVVRQAHNGGGVYVTEHSFLSKRQASAVDVASRLVRSRLRYPYDAAIVSFKCYCKDEDGTALVDGIVKAKNGLGNTLSYEYSVMLTDLGDQWRWDSCRIDTTYYHNRGELLQMIEEAETEDERNAYVETLRQTDQADRLMGRLDR